MGVQQVIGLGTPTTTGGTGACDTGGERAKESLMAGLIRRGECAIAALAGGDSAPEGKNSVRVAGALTGS
jgi:hypothetical protein